MLRSPVSYHGEYQTSNVHSILTHTSFFRLGNNLSGQYKRGVGMALHIGIGNFGGGMLYQVASSIFVLTAFQLLHPTFIVLRMRRDTLLVVSPHPYPLNYYKYLMTSSVDAIELMFVGIGFITLPMAVFIYLRINAKRDRLVKEMEEKGAKLSAAEIRELGDRAPDFRYTL